MVTHVWAEAEWQTFCPIAGAYGVRKSQVVMTHVEKYLIEVAGIWHVLPSHWREPARILLPRSRVGPTFCLRAHPLT